MQKKVKKRNLNIIGWREWIEMPDFGVSHIKAKIDTGARSSSIHAVKLKTYKKEGKIFAEFIIHPIQRRIIRSVKVKSEVIEFRSVKSSSGTSSIRPVIMTNISILGELVPIELTLAGREDMGFRMLLGREALRGRFIVDPSKSYYNGKPSTRIKASDNAILQKGIK